MSELLARYATELERPITEDLHLPEATPENAQALASALREQGFPVQAYRLAEGKFDIQNIPVPFPFLALLNREWALVTPEAIIGERGELPQDSLPVDPLIVGEPPVGLRFRVAEQPTSPNPHNEIAIFYTTTNAPRKLAEEQLTADLRSLIEHGRKCGKKVIFIDSLGLVPLEQINGLGGDRTAFEAALAQIRKEVETIASEVSRAHDPRNPVWEAAYEVLHETQVKTVLEDLRFEVWRKAVDFDSQHLARTAVEHFIAHQLDKAAELMSSYELQFHHINCHIRNENLVSQITGLADSEGLLLLMLREIGHFGILEKSLPTIGFSVQSKLLGYDRFPLLLAKIGMEAVLSNIGVPLTPPARRLIALRSCLKAVVLQALVKDKPIPEFTSSIPDLHEIDRLSWETIDMIINELHSPIRVYLRSAPYNQRVQEQLLYLLREYHIISPSLIPETDLATGDDKND